MDSDEYMDEVARVSRYRRPLQYEALLNKQLDRIAGFRSQKNIMLYEYSIDTLILMLPQVIREKAMRYKEEHDIQYNTTSEGREKYDRLWGYINTLMEEEGLIFKRIGFELGHD